MELKIKYEPDREFHKDEYGFERNQWVFKFDNGYGASVICHYTTDLKVFTRISTYGSKEKPFELGVIKFVGDSFELVYDTPITDDVIGYLTEKEVEEYLEKIENL